MTAAAAKEDDGGGGNGGRRQWRTAASTVVAGQMETARRTKRGQSTPIKMIGSSSRIERRWQRWIWTGNEGEMEERRGERVKRERKKGHLPRKKGPSAEASISIKENPTFSFNFSDGIGVVVFLNSFDGLAVSKALTSMRQKAGVPSDGLPTVWPSLTSAPDLLRFQMNFSDGCFILPTSEPSVTSASISRRYWPSLQRGNVVVFMNELIMDGFIMT
ncbi:hypothetical protein PIB30_067161 [Stylosanthes scabra]|uniref:Uncharacterized protein n=1 Tax=Stylosanthes scabra TaxID=79078 RepID=A0ABU6RMX1_9FABA|nr:hypothetical protein [Stylosanthes scabra]